MLLRETEKIRQRVLHDEDPRPVLKEIKAELVASQSSELALLHGRPGVICQWHCAYAVALWRTYRYQEAADELQTAKAIIDRLGIDTAVGKSLLNTVQTVANYPGLEAIEDITDVDRRE